MEVWVLSDEMYTWFYLFFGFCGLRLCVFCVTYSFPCFTWSMCLVFELSFSFFSFPLYFNWGFNQPVIHIGSLDLCHRKPGFVHGLTVVISLWRVCVCLSVCGCVQGSSCMMDEAGTFLVMYSQFCCSVVENEKHPPASTGTTLYSPPPPPPSVSQQAEWILMEPVYHASVFPFVYQQPVPFLASL